MAHHYNVESQCHLPSRGLLEETQFQKAVVRSLAEPTPYFCQFWSEESAKRQEKRQSLGGTSTTTPSAELSTKGRKGEEYLGGGDAYSVGTSETEESVSVIIRKEQCREQKEAIIR